LCLADDAELGGRLYVAGGLNSSSQLTKTLYIYAAATNSWTRGADMPQAGGCGAEGVISGKLYVYVGCTGVPFGDQLFQYDPATNKWTALAAPPHQHAGGAGGVINGRFYLAGGTDDGAATTTATDIYNPASNS
jgi:N-acetylneuraminic acid mutarotase